MPGLMKFALLMTLLCSCGSSYPVSVPVEPCRVPAFPAPPAVNPEGCGERVCWTIDDTLRLTRWIAEVHEYNAAVHLCPYVVAE